MAATSRPYSRRSGEWCGNHYIRRPRPSIGDSRLATRYIYSKCTLYLAETDSLRRWQNLTSLQTVSRPEHCGIEGGAVVGAPSMFMGDLRVSYGGALAKTLWSTQYSHCGKVLIMSGEVVNYDLPNRWVLTTIASFFDQRLRNLCHFLVVNSLYVVGLFRPHIAFM